MTAVVIDKTMATAVSPTASGTKKRQYTEENPMYCRFMPRCRSPSVLFGIILLRLAPKAIKVRRTAWVVFIIGIPVVVLFLIFGTAILADAFAS